MARKRIRIADFRGEPAELEMPDGTVYLIRGDLPMEVVNYIGDFEERGTDGTAEEDVEEFDRWLTEGHDLIQKIVREGAPDQRDAELPALSPQEMLGIMGAMIGGESVGEALAKALNDGIGESMRERAELDKAERAAEKDADPPKPAKRPARARKTAATPASTKP